jgi:hypothetical protein
MLSDNTRYKTDFEPFLPEADIRDKAFIICFTILSLQHLL